MAVVGLAKNAGKTVAFNTLVRQAAGAGIRVGLTSLGYDGESVDRLTRQPKPRIYVPAETIIATAAATLERASASLELLNITRHNTALGPTVLARVRESGTVELAGPGSLTALQQVAVAMQDWGAAYVFIDGALDRLGSAAPRVSQATILATGASVAPDPAQVIARTRHTVTLLTAPSPPPMVAAVAQTAFADERIAYWHPEKGAWQSAQPSALAQPAQIVSEMGEASHLCIPGAVTNSLVQALLHAKPTGESLPVIVVPTGTHVLATPSVWHRYLERGGSLAVLQSTKLLAVTVNPGQHSHLGQALAQALHPLPVYDLFLDDKTPLPV